MKPSRINYYDPLYDFVSFEEAAAGNRSLGIFDAGFTRRDSKSYGESISSHRVSKELLPFLSAIEFARQAFLRQSNLAFLVFPSATHTRLAHSIGSCYLGFLASQRIAVGARRQGDENPPSAEYLSHFLERTGLREEFFLALLLHDVGHFPFSHALESNKEFWDVFGELHHEDAACQLIRGDGPIFEASRRRSSVRGKRRQEHPHLSELFKGKPDIDTDAICYLISGDRSYLDKFSVKRQVKLLVLHELVSGLLDLDRVDHYRRDNYFTGLRAGTTPNFPSLLSGITIYYEADGRNHRHKSISLSNRHKNDVEMRLSPCAIGPAISLLQTKERLTEDCFEHIDCIAYEVMLHQAFNLFFNGNFYEADVTGIEDEERQKVFDLLISTDDELLSKLHEAGSGTVQEIVFRIRNRLPYTAVAKLRFEPDHSWGLREIRETLASAAKVRKTNVVLRPSKRFGEKDMLKRSEEWLDLTRLRNHKGLLLTDSKYKRQIEHFRSAQESADFIWLFSVSDDNVGRLQRVLPKLSSKLGYKIQEEM
jgi:HD superfamily phosphohydrolase